MPKKAATASASAAAKPKRTKPVATHAPYLDMIIDAIKALKDRNGSSRQAIKKYIQANNKLSGVTDTQFNRYFNRAIANAVKAEKLAQPKGASGPVKLARKEKPEAARKITAAAPASEAPKKAALPKKVAPKKAAVTKKTTAAAPKKAAAAAKPAKPAKAAAKKETKTAAAAAPKKKTTTAAADKTKTGRVAKPKAARSTTAKTSTEKTKKAKAAAAASS